MPIRSLALATLAFWIITITAVLAQPMETELVTTMGDTPRCRTLEDWHTFWTTDNHIPLLDSGACSKTPEGTQPLYVTKRGTLDGRPYVCLRVKTETTCQSSEERS